MFDDELDAPTQLQRVLYSRVFKFYPQGSLTGRDDHHMCITCKSHVRHRNVHERCTKKI